MHTIKVLGAKVQSFIYSFIVYFVLLRIITYKFQIFSTVFNNFTLSYKNVMKNYIIITRFQILFYSFNWQSTKKLVIFLYCQLFLRMQMMNSNYIIRNYIIKICINQPDVFFTILNQVSIAPPFQSWLPKFEFPQT